MPAIKSVKNEKYTVVLPLMMSETVVSNCASIIKEKKPKINPQFSKKQRAEAEENGGRGDSYLKRKCGDVGKSTDSEEWELRRRRWR